MTTRNVTKNPITEEDMVLGIGTVTQVRGVSRELSKVSFTKVVASTTDLLTLTGVPEVRVQDGDLYKYVTGGAFVTNATTIVPTGGDGTEAWVRTFAIDKYVSTLADLRAAYVTEGQTIHIKGHTTEGIGGGEFRIISATEAADKGYTDTDITPLLADGKYGERKLAVSPTPEMFGADPTGVEDCSSAIQTAVDAGFSLTPVFGSIYRMVTAVNVTTAIQIASVFFSAGAGTFVSAGSEPCFRLYHEDASIVNTRFSGEGSYAASPAATTGALIRMLGDNQRVAHNHFDGYRYAIEARGVNNPTIIHNIGRNGLTSAADTNSTAGIFIDYRTDDSTSVTDGTIEHNDCEGGFGFGISVYAEDSTSDGGWNGSSVGGLRNVKIRHNRIVDGYAYGIQLYRRGGSSQLNVISCEVAHNTVYDITGKTINAGNGDKIYGTGIYVQGAERAWVHHNDVKRTCFATDNDLLAPAGIGFVNVAEGLCEDNEVEEIGTQEGATATAGGAGIWNKGSNVTAASFAAGLGADPTNVGVISRRNRVRNTRISGIVGVDCHNFETRDFVKDAGFYSVYIYRSGGGIFGGEYSFCESPIVGDGTETVAGVNHSVYLVECNNHNIQQIKSLGSGADGIRLQACGPGKLTNQKLIKDPTGRHIVVLAGNDPDQIIKNNTLDGAGVGQQILCYVPATIDENQHINATTEVRMVGASTDDNGYWTLVDGDTTPDVGNAVKVSCNNTSPTTITALDSAQLNFDFELLVLDANTTLQFSGAALEGNGGVDKTFPAGSLIRCRKRGNVVYCMF